MLANELNGPHRVSGPSVMFRVTLAWWVAHTIHCEPRLAPFCTVLRYVRGRGGGGRGGWGGGGGRGHWSGSPTRTARVSTQVERRNTMAATRSTRCGTRIMVASANTAPPTAHLHGTLLWWKYSHGDTNDWKRGPISRHNLYTNQIRQMNEANPLRMCLLYGFSSICVRYTVNSIASNPGEFQ